MHVCSTCALHSPQVTVHPVVWVNTWGGGWYQPLGTDQLPDFSFDGLIAPLNINKTVFDYNRLFVTVQTTATQFVDNRVQRWGPRWQ